MTKVSEARPAASGVVRPTAVKPARLVVLDRATRWAALTGSVLSACAIVFMMVLMVTDVLLRLRSGSPVSGAYETVQALVVLIVFLGLAHSERSGHTIRVTVLTAALPPAPAQIARRIGQGLTLGIALWLTYATALAALESWASGEYTRALVDFPLWPSKLVIFLGCVMLALQLFLNLFGPAEPKAQPGHQIADGAGE
jgi:TRAP-type C4-dicarboxylate transport system permease small subunit